MRTTLTLAIAVLLLVATALDAEAQAAAAPGIVSDSPSALVLEVVGASAGSFIGIGAVRLLKACGVDDMRCDFVMFGAEMVAGVAGATAGTMLTARYTGSRRSVGGATLGAALGTGVGLGVHYLLNNNSDRNLDDAVVIPIFAISQGVFAALGSRLLGAARGMR